MNIRPKITYAFKTVQEFLEEFMPDVLIEVGYDIDALHMHFVAEDDEEIIARVLDEINGKWLYTFHNIHDGYWEIHNLTDVL
jgi:hypothetical protein